MFPRTLYWPLAFALTMVCALPSAAVDKRSAEAGLVDCTTPHLNQHNPRIVGPVDIELCFPAYVSSFDGDDDDDDDGEPDLLRVPHWVAQWVKPAGRAVESNKRPSSWYTVPALNDQDIAPTDASYQFSQSFRRSHPNWYDRGHLAQKYLTERFGEEAGRFSHSVANAVPQRSRFNSHPWLELECRTGAWANRYRGLWVVTGPVFLNGKPTAWLTEPGRRNALPVAIPDALFKVVVRERSARLDWLAFLYPQDSPEYRRQGPWDPGKRLVSIARIEQLTKLEFFPGAGVTQEQKKRTADALWIVEETDFDPGCKRFAKGAK